LKKFTRAILTGKFFVIFGTISKGSCPVSFPFSDLEEFFRKDLYKKKKKKVKFTYVLKNFNLVYKK